MALPKRKVHLVVEEMGEETLVYCGEAQKAFCLNPVCTRVFAMCDGTLSLPEMATRLGLKEAALKSSLAILQEHDLLEPLEGIKRRSFLKGAAAAVPAVLAVAAPSPAMAASAAQATGCLNEVPQCQSLGDVNVCRPCDTLNRTPANCTGSVTYCMSHWIIRVDASGNHIPGLTCGNDTRDPRVNQCETVNNVNFIWALDCDDARTAAIARRLPGQSYDVYKCCHCNSR